MTVTVYRSSDASAPGLTGQVGSLIGVLDACLVNGYGAKAAAGWAKPFAGTNIAAYRAATGNQFYLGVDDTGTQNVRLRGFETMSAAGVAVGSGTGPFPTDAQQSGGMYTFKSAAASSQVRPWVLFASGTFLMMFIDQSTASATMPSTGVSTSWSFGDFFSYAVGDAYNTMMGGGATAGGADTYNLMYAAGAAWNTGADAYAPYAPRVPAGTGASAQMMKLGAFANASSGNASVVPYPMNGIAGIQMHPVYLSQPTLPQIRGQIPGLWHTMQNGSNFTHGDTFSGAAGTPLAGRTFEIVKNVSVLYCVFVETSDWAVLGA